MAWGGSGWNHVDTKITPETAMAQAIEALGKTDDTLAHMEIVRRAVVYVSGHGKGMNRRKLPDTAALLVRTLEREAKALERRAAEEPELLAKAQLARFDYAYAAAGLDQVGIDVDVDYHAELKKILRVRKDAAMHFGAALALWMHSREQREAYEHLEVAIDAAAEHELLAKNLVDVAGDFVGADSLEALSREVSAKLGRS